MIRKNDIVSLEIKSMTYEGYGVARYSDDSVENFVIFVSNAAVGDAGEYRIVKTEKKFAFAIPLSLSKESELRTDPLCGVYGKCGGCVFFHITYEAESTAKQEFVINELKKNYPECTVTVSSLVKAPCVSGYRNKAQFPLTTDGKCGYFARHSHRVVPATDCALNDPAFGPVIRAFEFYVRTFSVSVYDEEKHKGLIRHFYLRRGHLSGEIMAVIVSTSEKLPHEDELKTLMDEVGVTSLYVNVNPDRTNVILGSKNRLLSGKEKITDTLCGLTFEISPLSFYQINSLQAEAVYRHAKDLLALTKDDVLLDLFCGIGTVGLSMADKAGRVIGVEIIPDAVRDAERNAALNSITNASFYTADASDVLSVLPEKPNAVVIDPPRKGLDEDALNALLTLMPERMVYISCNPSTLSRDLKRLSETYRVESITPFDMFPRTAHVETVCLLTRKMTVHAMKLNQKPFEMIKSGKKTIELRLFDEKRQKINVGDCIEFSEKDTGEKLTVRVEKLHRFETFEELYRSLPLTKCGYTEDSVLTAKPSDMEEYYSAEEQKQYGVVGIEISLLKR